MAEENPDIQIVVNPKVTSTRYFIHLAREFHDEASAAAHLERIKHVIDIEGSHMVVFQVNINGKEAVVLFLEPQFDTESDRRRATAELCTAGTPMELPPNAARRLGQMIIEAEEEGRVR